ncbi:MAG: GAF domain-containing protein [Nitriliruptoraceae bacterium]|nr:GAF domain-containing protein [Nitriliruptoraceae bacterium]
MTVELRDRVEVGPGSLRARFQPLLLSAAALIVLPALWLADAATWVLVVLVLAAVAGGLGGVAARRGVLTRDQRERLALVFTLIAVAGFNLTLVTIVVGGGDPGGLVLVAAALLCALVAAPSVVVRGILSVLTVLPLVIAMALDGVPPVELLLVIALLMATATVGWSMAGSLRHARRDANRQRQAIEQRNELLETVRDLPGDSLPDAAAACCRTLRDLGADAAGVSRIGIGVLRPVHLEGLEPVGGPVAHGQGVLWRAIERDEPLVIEDYATHADALRARTGLGRVVIVPMRTRDEVVGVVFAAWAEPGAVTTAEVELVEVLAAHLGVIAAADHRIARQRELLVRLGMLDRMRRELLGAMSEELRDPLTVLRGVVQILDAHDGRLRAAQRAELLERLEYQTVTLRRLVDGVLDFSRSQRGQDPAVVPTELAPMLAGLPRAVAATERLLHPPSEGGATVLADAALVRAAVDLLIRTAADTPDGESAHILLDEGPSTVQLRLRGLGEVPDLVRDMVGTLLRAAGAELQDRGAMTVVLQRLPTVSPAPDAGVGVAADVEGGHR